MIELKNLTKVYKGKGSARVKALDGVSFVLPDKGLVFILGKSGCGKSTLLNLVGGLDKPTEGEIIIKGRSSKEFSASDFDSYRNTYVGFIFQEYNVMPEFSVYENITLATELQGRKPEKEQTGGIIEEVELTGLEKRKPTTLSGGQKQRVAIARALVKDPQIILADEPTGALDSNTGKAVLDLLKRLSNDKLVVVVSHDRDFANKYADRIIELHDGRVISDQTFVHKEAVEENGLTVGGDGVYVKSDLNAGMLDRLNALLREKQVLTIKAVEEGAYIEGGGFEPTVMNDSPAESSVEKLIRSKFPLKYAFRMGASGLRTKRFRLVLTILLSTVALTAFGFMLALMAFDAQYTLKNALEEGGQTELGVAYYEIENNKIPILNIDYTYSFKRSSTKESIEKLEKDTGLQFLKVHQFISDGGKYYGGGETFDFSDGISFVDTYVYDPTYFCGFATVTEDQLKQFGGRLIAGKMPSSSNDILISDLICKTIFDYAIKNESGKRLMGSETDYPVGKPLKIRGVEYNICGVFSAPRPDEKFDELKNVVYSVLYDDRDEGLFGNTDLKRLYTLRNELQSIYNSSLATVCFVNESFYGANFEFLSSYRDKYVQSVNSSFYFWGSAEVFREGNPNYKLLDGKKFENGSYLITQYGMEPIIRGCLEAGVIDYDTADTLFTQTIDILNNLSGQQAVDAMYDILNTLCSSGGAPLDGVEFSTGDSEKTLTLACAGVVFSDTYEQMQITIDDMRALFPYATDSVDLSTADFLLTVNTSKARSVLTDLKFGDTGTYRFDFYNCYQSETIDEYRVTIATISSVLFWVGVVVAVFASLLLFNFISVSINYKKKEIGILRALGARKTDVFKVFFSESLIIIGICYLLSVIFSIVLLVRFNVTLKEDFLISATLFFFGPLQALILGGLALGVSFISTILPVVHHAKKPPVDAIRAL